MADKYDHQGSIHVYKKRPKPKPNRTWMWVLGGIIVFSLLSGGSDKSKSTVPAKQGLNPTLMWVTEA